MAHAKTSLAQIFSQLGIGAGLGVLCYRSFAEDKPTHSPPVNQQSVDVAALDAAVAKDTTGRAWGLPTGDLASHPKTRRSEDARAP